MPRYLSAPVAASMLAATLLLAGCDRNSSQAADASGLTTSNGDVSMASYESLQGALNGEVTSDQYRKWVAAKQALDRVPNLPPPVKAGDGQISDADIDRAVQRLESNARARAAIEGAGMSVREYVLTTVALDRAMKATTASAPAPATPPVVDTGMVATQPYPAGGAYYPAPPPNPPASYPQPPVDPLPGAAEPVPPAYTPVPAPGRRTERRLPDSNPVPTSGPVAPVSKPAAAPKPDSQPAPASASSSPSPVPPPASPPPSGPDAGSKPAAGPATSPPAEPPPAKPDTGSRGW